MYLNRSVKFFKTVNKFTNFRVNNFQKQYFHQNFLSFQPEIQFKLADIGEGIKEVEIIQWFLKEGDKIEQFDKVAEVQSDKANVEITSRYSGVITKVHHKVGDIAQVGYPLIDIEVPEGTKIDGASQPKKEKVEEKETNITQTTQTTTTDSKNSKVKTTPSVRRIAREENINLNDVTATGKDGRILKQDVMEYLDNKDKPKVTTTSQISLEEDEEVPVRGLMRTMIKTMEAANQVPQLGYSDEIYLDELMKFRSTLKKVAEERDIKLSFMPFFIKASSLALKQYPILNSQLNSEKTILTYKKSHNIGFALDTKNGLYVPNIKNVQNLSILEIAQELNRLIKAGQDGKLSEDDLKGGTFTLSNVGSIGGTYASPILVVPQVAIAALGKIKRVPIFDENDQVKPANLMNISWSADHRIIDGATIARFSNLIKLYLESPLTMIGDMK
eukprot:gene122-4368_t